MDAFDKLSLAGAGWALLLLFVAIGTEDFKYVKWAGGILIATTALWVLT